MMIEPTPTPSLLLKVSAVAARWALGVVALAWIVLAIIWGGLHFLIVPRIADFRPMLELRASKALGATVRVGEIVAKSNGLIPSIELRDVVVLDGANREALRLPKILVALSPRSALSMGFEQLYIESPVLDIRRTADGRIWIAGFALPEASSADTAGVDWIFSQSEVAIVHGTVTWTDELRGAPPLSLSAVDLVLRNRLLTHALRLDATPPAEWGERLSLQGVFKQPLLSRRAGDWKSWQGQIYTHFGQVDLAQLRRYADVGVDVVHGAGALSAWVDVDRGALTGVTADLALKGVNVRVDTKLEALAFDQIAGRLGVKWMEGGFEFQTQGLQFDTHDGLHWPGGNVRVALFGADAHKPARGELVADKLDLAAIEQIANRLPLGDEAHAALKRLSPSGLVEQVQASWAGPLAEPTQFSVKGRVVNLTIAATAHDGVQTPGFKGVDIDFEANPAGGKASLAMRNGVIDALGVFDEPVMHFDQLGGEVVWKTQGSAISVSVPRLRFSNADAQGELQLKWQTAPTGESKALAGASRFPGVMDLQGTLSRASANRVSRYLPTVLDKEVRDYLHDALLGGSASAVKFKVKGNLNDFPFSDPKLGEFRISLNVQNVTYAYAPASILPKGSLPWPVLSQLSGELLIDRGALQIKGARGSLAGSPGLKISKADALISNLYDEATLVVTAEAQGPLAEGLGLVLSSPLNEITGKALARATATGAADYRVKLGFPLAAVERIAVQGSVALAGNDLQISPDTPRLTRARGLVAFSETGFSLTGGQARTLGGEMRIEGGLSVAVPARAAPLVLRMQGTASAEGLRQAKELGFAARLVEYASGAAAYTAVLGLRGGVTELQINSSLVGLALNLPAPFAKTAEASLPLRLETTAVRTPQPPAATAAGVVYTQDQFQLDVGRLANFTYVRDVTGPEPRVLRGAIGVGLAADESAPLPMDGVVANINLDSVDLDAWIKVLSNASGTDLAAANQAGASAATGMAYLPTSMAIRANELVFEGRKLNRVVVGGGREGLLWRANLDASELSGYVEYRQPAGANAGRLYARLARLVIGQSTAQDVENLLDAQPASIPALDVVVEDLELRGKKWGRVEIDAVNLGAGAARETAKEWRLNRFNVITPEAVLSASGNWTNINVLTAPNASRSIKDRRRTVMNFKLDIANAGDVLNRFGMSGVVRKGSGKMEGQVAWLGSPITLDYPSLSGNFNVDIETGQFLKADPGLAKLLGVLSLQALPRRLALDFRDVFSEGFAFDFVRGDVVIEQGIARTNNLQMKGVNAAVLMEGQADIARETQAVKVVVIPEINAGSASLIATAINPLVGLTTFLAQVILRRPLIEAATQEFFVDGTWVDPRVTKVPHNSPPATPLTAKPETSK
jgi:uncharacterized protein (TIGR02099 family)